MTGKSEPRLGSRNQAHGVISYVERAPGPRDKTWYQGLAYRISEPHSTLRMWSEGRDLSLREIDLAIDSVSEAARFGQYTTTKIGAAKIHRSLDKLRHLIHSGHVPKDTPACQVCGRFLSRKNLRINPVKICNYCARLVPRGIWRKALNAKPGTSAKRFWLGACYHEARKKREQYHNKSLMRRVPPPEDA
jgi:hypothetical protein